MKMFNVQSPYHDIIKRKRKCKFLRSIVSSENLYYAKFAKILLKRTPPLPSNRHHRRCGDCLEGKWENYHVCSVQYCAPQLCTVRCTHAYEQTNSSLDWVLSHWAHFTVLRFIFTCIMCIIVYCVHV